MEDQPEYKAKESDLNIPKPDWIDVYHMIYEKQYGWQTCPRCNGQGIIDKPPHIFGQQQTWVDTQMNHPCPVCCGKMIINIVTGKPPKS
jgi:DnaJ-class molecular chaperone